jgi:integrase
MGRAATGTVHRYAPAKAGERHGHYVVRLTAPDGTRPLVHLDSSPRSPQAETRARETAAHLAEGGRMPVPTRRHGTTKAGTVAEWFGRWLQHRETAGLASVATDRGRYDVHVAPVLGHLAMRAVTRRDVEGLVEALDAKVRTGSLAWKSAANVWTLVTKAFDDACASKALALRVLEQNPAAAVRGPDRGDHRAKAYLYPSEFSAVMACEAVPLAWRRAIAVATCLYVRAGELRALTWAAVDVERGLVHVHCAKDRAGKIKPTKTGVARRVPIEPVLLPVLRAMQAEGGPVVALPDDRHLARALRGILRTAGVDREDLHADDATRKPMTWHDLRATGLTWLAVRGDDPLKIMRRAGHTSFATTQLYVREAEAIRDGFGVPFPALSDSCLNG